MLVSPDDVNGVCPSASLASPLIHLLATCILFIQALVERLLAASGMTLTEETWRQIVIGALILTTKTHRDKPYLNKAWADLWPEAFDTFREV